MGKKGSRESGRNQTNARIGTSKRDLGGLEGVRWLIAGTFCRSFLDRVASARMTGGKTAIFVADDFSSRGLDTLESRERRM